MRLILELAEAREFIRDIERYLGTDDAFIDYPETMSLKDIRCTGDNILWHALLVFTNEVPSSETVFPPTLILSAIAVLNRTLDFINLHVIAGCFILDRTGSIIIDY